MVINTEYNGGFYTDLWKRTRVLAMLCLMHTNTVVTWGWGGG